MLRNLYHKYMINNQTVRTTVETVTSTKQNIQRFMELLPDIKVSRIEGDRGTLIYVGDDGPTKQQILQAVFPHRFEETGMERVNVWQLPQFQQKWLDENDIVLYRVSRFFPFHLPAAYAFDNPLSVQQVVPLGASVDEMLAGGSNKRLRKEISRMRKQNFTVRSSQTLEDLDFFYHKMYVPTLQARYDDRGEHYPYEFIQQILENGFLSFLSLDDEVVMGTLYRIRGKVLYTNFTGLMDGNTGLLKHDINVAQNWFDMNHAIERGMEVLNWMSSNAWASDGVFYFKQRWGAQVQPNTYQSEKLLFRANTLSAKWRDRLNNIGFITQQGKQFLRVYIDEAVPSIEEARTQAEKHGLNGIHVLSPQQSLDAREANSPSMSDRQAG